MAVFIADYADGRLRRKIVIDDKRSRLILPPRDFLRNRLVEVGGDRFDEKCLYSLGADVVRSITRNLGDGYRLRALVILQPAQCHDDILSVLTSEEKLLKEYYGFPLDSYSVLRSFLIIVFAFV